MLQVSVREVLSNAISPLSPLLQPRVGDQVFYLAKGRPAAEFMATLWYLVHRRFKKSLPVTVASTIKYQRPGGQERVLECDPNFDPGEQPDQ